MSRLESLAPRAAVCTKCSGQRYVTRAGAAQAEALRCETCFSVCSTCDGRGYSFVSDWTGALVASPCDCLELDARIALYNGAQLPRRYATAGLTAGTEDVNDSVRAARVECYKRTVGFTVGDRGVGLTGPVGVGKTHLMAGLIRALTLENGVPCLFVEFTHLLAELREGFERGAGAADAIARAVDVPVLVIDELGKGLSTEWQMATLDELVSKRYNSQVTTCFTSNFSVARPARSGPTSRERFESASLEDRIGARMASRLAEMCDIIAIDGPDYRRRGGA
ncbi:MAG: ATP-binding protein [Myxococcales bacterium]|nr:ATP-binding protein [Myxococcales bacterium]MCB9531263.1 ATP-binding protein [Myxococcales bacterium]